jgi:hypothetical protein
MNHRFTQFLFGKGPGDLQQLSWHTEALLESVTHCYSCNNQLEGSFAAILDTLSRKGQNELTFSCNQLFHLFIQN